MKGLLLLLIHLVAVLARLLGSGGVRGLVAENVPIKQQLLILSRTRQRALNLSSLERFVLSLCILFVAPPPNTQGRRGRDHVDAAQAPPVLGSPQLPVR